MKENIFIIFILSILLLSSCNKDNPVSINDDMDNTVSEIDDNIIECDDNVEEDDSNKIISPLDGQKYYERDLLKRPVAISIDNHPNARWQAGLKDAEIIYECEVEYPYTRYLCIFLAKEPEIIGPVRSARPYLIYYALEYDGIFVHVGGSEDAFSEIKRLIVPDVDGLYSGAMWRYYDTDKFAPHNMYTTLKSIRDEAFNYGYKEESDYEGYQFNESTKELSKKYEEVFTSTEINIKYNKYNTTDYKYDEENKLYLRYKDGSKHIDELYNEQLTTKNLIILEVSKSVLDSEGRLYLDTVGNGNGIYITNKEAIKITWEKSSEKLQTKFYINNEELLLNPGNTWIQIVNSLQNVNIE